MIGSVFPNVLWRTWEKITIIIGGKVHIQDKCMPVPLNIWQDSPASPWIRTWFPFCNGENEFQVFFSPGPEGFPPASLLPFPAHGAKGQDREALFSQSLTQLPMWASVFYLVLCWAKVMGMNVIGDSAMSSDVMLFADSFLTKGEQPSLNQNNSQISSLSILNIFI